MHQTSGDPEQPVDCCCCCCCCSDQASRRSAAVCSRACVRLDPLNPLDRRGPLVVECDRARRDCRAFRNLREIAAFNIAVPPSFSHARRLAVPRQGVVRMQPIPNDGHMHAATRASASRRRSCSSLGLDPLPEVRVLYHRQ